MIDRVVLICRAHGLPEPEREQRFDPVRRWRADYLWRSPRVILEVEGGIARGGSGGGVGFGGHSSFAGIMRDIDKSNAAQLGGFLYLRATPAQVGCDAFVAMLHTALRGDRAHV